MTTRAPAAFGTQCEGVHHNERAAFFCVLDTTTGLHTHVCHLHRRLLVDQWPNAVAVWKKCQWQSPSPTAGPPAMRTTNE